MRRRAPAATIEAASCGQTRGRTARSLPKGDQSPMKVLRLLYVLCARAYYARALAEIDLLHPDVPRIVLRLHELEIERRHLCDNCAAANRGQGQGPSTKARELQWHAPV